MPPHPLLGSFMGCPGGTRHHDFLFSGRSCLIWGCDTLIKQGLEKGLEALLCPIFLWLLALRIKQANAKSPKLGLINDQVEVQVLHDFSLSRKKRILVALHGASCPPSLFYLPKQENP